MSEALPLFLALGIGVVAGLRSLTAPALVAWAAHCKWLKLDHSVLGFLGSTAAVVVLSLLAIGELVMDKLPFAPEGAWGVHWSHPQRRVVGRRTFRGH